MSSGYPLGLIYCVGVHSWTDGDHELQWVSICCPRFDFSYEKRLGLISSSTFEVKSIWADAKKYKISIYKHYSGDLILILAKCEFEQVRLSWFLTF